MSSYDLDNTAVEQTESFAELYEQSIREEKREGTVVRGFITKITDKEVFVDVGLKSEGRIDIAEFEDARNSLEIGSSVDVFIERLEDRHGNTILSKREALKEEAWFVFEDLHKQGVNVEGKIMGRVKGGFAVDIGKIIAFLPGSQVDIRPIKDHTALLNEKQPFKILKMDRVQGNIVVSRRAILEESRAEARDALLANIAEGSVLEGNVKNITDYGAFIDLGSIDGLLHITDISWSKISHPSEMLSLGQTVKVMVIKYNEETKRVSLGLKQLEKNPWEGLVDKYLPGNKFEGTITTITEYGAFVLLEPGVEGLVYLTEISWNSKNSHPRRLLKVGDKVDVMVLEVDVVKHKISLSIKQCKENPWRIFEDKHPIGSEISGVVQNVVDFGMFILLNTAPGLEQIEALIPAIELSWEEKPEVVLKRYNKGDSVTGKILSVDPERERIIVGLKQMQSDNFASTFSGMRVGEVVTCTVVSIQKEGIEVEVAQGANVFIKKAELSKHRSEQRPERFGVGDKIDTKLVSMDLKDRKVLLSIKALEVEEEKRAIEEYGSKDSGASLGDILGVALNKDMSEK